MNRRTSAAAAAVLLLSLLGLGGCPFASTAPGICFDALDCPAGYRCSEGACEQDAPLPATDGGNVDAAEHWSDGSADRVRDAAADAGPAEVGGGDHAASDRGSADTAQVDAGLADRGASDREVADAGTDAGTEAGPGADAGVADSAASVCDPLSCPGSTNPCLQPICDGSGGCAQGLVGDGQPCPDGVCVQGGCEPRCYIDGSFVDADQLDPLDPCQACRPALDPLSYQDREDGAFCADGLYCSGIEQCWSGRCEASGDPCAGLVSTPYCKEASDSCVACLLSNHCPDDGAHCNGSEFCGSGDSCTHSGDPCSHLVATPHCKESNDSCVACLVNGHCPDDGAHCNGSEICGGANSCVHSGDPCAELASTPHCKESADSCVACLQNVHCPDDGLWCNGSESCSAGNSCVHSGNPCSGIRPVCAEASDSCVCSASSCPAGFTCNSAGRCRRTLTLELASNSEDGFQDPYSGNRVLLNYSWISMYSPLHVGGLRFQIPEVARNAWITHAHLRVFVDTQAEGNANLDIYVQTSSLPAIMSASTANDITARPRNSTPVYWGAAGLAAGWQTSPELASLVQLIVDRSDWVANRRIFFVLIQRDNTAFEFRQRDYASNQAAALVVTYDGG